MSDAEAAKLARRTVVAAVATVLGIAAVGVVVWTQRPQLAPIEVSQQTTYVITPTRADGWVDYPQAVDWMRRASLDAGGANAAVPLVRALGKEVVAGAGDRDAILKRLGIGEAHPQQDAGAGGATLTPLRAFTGPDGAAAPEPPPAALQWLRDRCHGGAQATFARIRGWLAAS